VYHAVTDAILGALARPDIGQLFPDDDPALDGADSARFVDAAAQMMRDDGYRVANLDVTVICERPRIGPMKHLMQANLARLLRCDAGRVNVKGRTHEQVDAAGAGRAVIVHAVVLIEASD
jgi:2-C-methyl-D-erythritol 2,4-cyclodiphosphate synthase